MNQQDLLTPVALWDASWAESNRRRDAARRGLPGAWAVITDPEQVRTVGARHAQIVAGDATNVAVRPFYTTSQFAMPRSAVAECLALGDHVDVGGQCGVVCSVVPEEQVSTALLLTPDWGVDGSAADAPAITLELPAGDVSRRSLGARTDAQVVNTSPTLESANGLFVRGVRFGRDGDWAVGPSLSLERFNRVAALAEPCMPRRDGTGKVIVENFLSSMNGNDDAILCDFLGGATLWIWKSVLVDNLILKIPWWDSPSHGHHPALAKIFRSSTERAALANAAHTLTPALAFGSGSVPALPPTENSTMTHLNLDLPHPVRGTLVVVNDKYRDHAVQLVARLRSLIDDEDVLADVSDDLDIIKGSAETTIVGAYEVRACFDLEIVGHGPITLAHCRTAGASGAARHLLVLGLVMTPNQLATASPKALARAGQAVARGAKGSLVAAKDAVVDAGKRKLETGAKVLAEGSLVSGHEAVRRGAGAAIGMLTGRDPAAVAEHPVFQQAFNEASTGGMRFAAKLIESFAPGTAKVVRGAADTLEEGIDRKQATKVLDAAAPMVGRGLQALAQAAVAKFMPALAPPAPAAALPPTPPPAAPAPDVEDDGPAPKPRRRKPRAAKPSRGETGGAS